MIGKKWVIKCIHLLDNIYVQMMRRAWQFGCFHNDVIVYSLDRSDRAGLDKRWNAMTGLRLLCMVFVDFRSEARTALLGLRHTSPM